MAETTCLLCQGTLSPFDGFARLHRVTSDSQPWPAGGHLAECLTCGLLQKPTDSVWRDETARIYADFSIYHQSDGAEQPIFIQGGEAPKPRSWQLLNRATTALDLAATRRMVDIGCGNGALLRSFAALRPNWRMVGTELNARYRDQVLAIPGVDSFNVGVPEQLDGVFDLVTLIHSLEHIDEPVALLSILRDKLAPDGKLLIQVPGWTQNPFDLLVADHCSHFTLESLAYVVSMSGWLTTAGPVEWLPKEISVVAQSCIRPVRPPQPSHSRAEAEQAVTWLLRFADAAGRLVERQDVGIFGTSIAGTWLAGQIDDRFAFFVDEDPARAARPYRGKPVFAPQNVPRDSLVIVAQPPEIAARICARLQAGPGVYWFQP